MTLAPVVQLPIANPALKALTAFQTHLGNCALAPLTKTTYGPAAAAYVAWLEGYEKAAEAFTGRVGAEGAATAYKRHLLDLRRAPATINKVLAAVELFYEVGCGLEVRVKRVRTPRPGEPDALVPAEEDRLREVSARLAEANPVWGLRNLAIVTLFLDAGPRRQELSSLRLDDVVVTARTGTVRLGGKGDQVRVVELSTPALKAIRAWLKVRRGLPGAPSDRLWLTRRATPLTHRGVEEVVGHLGRLTGTERLHPHRLRHTFAHNLAQKGVPLPTIQYLMGHASIETTARYTRSSRREAAEAIRAVFG